LTIKPFCTPAVEIAGRVKEQTAVNNSRPGVDGNTTPPPIPSTGTVEFFIPSASANVVPQSYNGQPVPKVPTVVSDDGDQRVI